MYQYTGTKYYTGFPLAQKELPSGYLGDFILLAPARVLLYSIHQGLWTITLRSTGAVYCTCNVTGEGVFPLVSSLSNSIVGYVKIDKFIPIYKIYNVEILDNVSYYTNLPTTGIVNFVNTSKYVPVLTEDTLSFSQAIYCGENLQDAILRVNGATGPTINFTTEGYIILKPDLIFDSSLPDVLCEREGIQGPKGPTGPVGPSGKDGEDASQVLMEFEGICTQ